jgi:hypothetical protein
MIMKYFNENGEQIFNEKTVDAHIEDYASVLDKTFASIMKYSINNPKK